MSDTSQQSNLLSEIERFLALTNMGETYFGKKAIGNSELVSRLRDSGRVWPETEERIRAFIADQKQKGSAAE